MDYEKMYKILFQAITTAIEQISDSKVVTSEMENGLKTLREAQQLAETMFVDNK